MGIMEYVRMDWAGLTFGPSEKLEFKKPVVFVFLGDFAAEETNAFLSLMQSLMGDSQRVRYVCMRQEESKDSEVLPLMVLPEGGRNPEANQKAWQENREAIRRRIWEYVADVYNQVATVPYEEKGWLRLHIILKAEDPLSNLIQGVADGFIEAFERVFSRVLADLYCLLDERQDPVDPDLKRARAFVTMEMLASMGRRPDYINTMYCMSNVNSKRVLSTEGIAPLLRSIGLLAILKDARTREGEFTYREGRYRQNMTNPFSTMGSLNFHKLDFAVVCIAFRQILRRLSHTHGPVSQEKLLDRLGLTKNRVDEDTKRVLGLRHSFEALYALVTDPQGRKSELLGKTRQELVREIFGQNLDCFMEWNYEEPLRREKGQYKAYILSSVNETMKQLYQQEGYSCCEVYGFVREEGFVAQAVRALNERYELQCQEAGQSLEQWLAGRADLSRMHLKCKEAGGASLIYYELADGYLQKRINLLQAQFKYEVTLDILNEIHLLQGRFRQAALLIETAIEELTEGVRHSVQGETLLRAGNCEEYYEGLIQGLLERDCEQAYQAFVREINDLAVRGELTEQRLYGRMRSFAGTSLLSRREFHMEFSEEMVQRLTGYTDARRQLYTREDIYALAKDTILGHPQYDLLAVDQAFTPYREICFFVKEDNAFLEYLRSEMETNGSDSTLNIFYDAQREGMDILYLEGNIGQEAIYASSGNREAYDRLRRDAGGNPDHSA